MATILFGALAPLLHKQFGVSRNRLGGAAQRAADAVVTLKVHGLLTDAEADRVRMRLVEKIERALRRASAAAGRRQP